MVNLDTTKRKWCILDRMDYSNGLVGKVSYINLELSDTIKEKADKFVCLSDHHYLEDIVKKSGTNIPEELLNYIFWNNSIVFAYVEMKQIKFTSTN